MTSGSTDLVLRRKALVVLLALFIAACSTGQYQQPIAAFSDSAKQARSALDGYNAVLADSLRQSRFDFAMRNKLRVKPDNCLPGDSSNCAAVYELNGKKVSLSPEPPLKNLPAIMAEIEAYALDLKDIAEADNSEAVGKDVDSISVSLNKLAKLSNQGQDVGPIAQAAGNSVKWVIGQYVESIKIEALRNSTEAANPVIKNAASYAASVAADADNTMRTVLSEEVLRANDSNVSSKNSPATAKALIESTEKFHAVQQTKPADTFMQFAKAHDELTKALKKSPFASSDLPALLAQVKGQIERLMAIVNQFRAAHSA